ncbi:MAG: DUF4349 domain-containing protein, partial [Acidimicrobiales bacterium]
PRLLVAAALLVVAAGTAAVVWGTRVASPPHVESAINKSLSLPPRPALNSPSFAFGSVNSVSGAADGSGVSLSAAQPKAASTGAVGQKIESTGAVTLRVTGGHVHSALTRLGDLAVGDGGSISRMHEVARDHATGARAQGVIELQVPQTRFAQLVRQVQHVGSTVTVQTSSSNVTSQYVDLASQIQSLQASRHQYLVIMARATTINGILAVQNQIDNLQSQIQQLQGQLHLLNHETTFATLDVTVTQSGVSQTTHHHSGVASAWDDSVGGFVRAFEGLIRVGGPALFVALCLAVLAGAGRVAWRWRVRRRL